MAVKFDTLRYAQTLQAGGFTEPQAAASAAALGMVLEESIPVALGDLVTKGDLLDTRLALSKELAAFRQDVTSEFAHVRADLSGEIGKVRTDLSREIAAFRQDVTSEFAHVRADLSGEITKVRTDLSREIAGSRVEIADIRGGLRLVQWMLGIVIAALGTLLAKQFL